MQKQKIRASDVENARRTLQQAPERAADELTKREAIQALAEEISAAQKKGYNLDAIAELLTSSGVTISRVLLASYLSHGSGINAGKRKRKRRVTVGQSLGAASGFGSQTSSASNDASTGPQPDVTTDIDAGTVAIDSGASTRAASGPSVATTVSHPAAAPVPAAVNQGSAVNEAKVRRPTEKAQGRQSAFIPRKDSDDL